MVVRQSETLINLYSNKIFKYDMLVNKNGELYVEPKDRVIISLTSTLVCTLLYLSSYVVFKIFSDTFKNLSKKDKMFWNLAVVRGVYGLIGTIFSLYARYFDEGLHKDIVLSKTVLSYTLVLSHLGFFIFEWTAQIYFDVRFKAFNQALHAHHIVSFLGYFLTVTSDKGHYTACSGFIEEMSTPFSCICFCLIKSKLADTLLWKINQLVLVHLFHMRSVIEFLMMYEYIRNYKSFQQLSLIWNIVFVGGTVVIGIFLTPYWTYKKTEQLFTRDDFSAKIETNGVKNKNKSN